MRIETWNGTFRVLNPLDSIKYYIQPNVLKVFNQWNVKKKTYFFEVEKIRIFCSLLKSTDFDQFLHRFFSVLAN